MFKASSSSRIKYSYWNKLASSSACLPNELVNSHYDDKKRAYRHSSEDRDVAEEVCNQGRHVVIETEVIGEVEAQCTPNEHKLECKEVFIFITYCQY